MNTPQTLESLIPIAAGVGLFLKMAGARGGADPVRKRRWQGLGVACALFGVIGVVSGLLAEPPAPDTRALATAMRARVKVPSMVDSSTRLDAIDARGPHLVFRYTLTAPPAEEAAREAVLAEMRRKLRGDACGDPGRRKLLQSGVGLEFEYTMSARRYPPIVVAASDCR